MNSSHLNKPDGAVDFLQRLVEIPSMSGKETALANYIVEQMQQAGFKTHIDEAGNAVGCRSCPDAAGEVQREILLLGHMDTVPGQIPVRQEGGKLYGRGAVDAKGPLAAFVVAGTRAALSPGTRLVIVGAVEEEAASSRGARYAAGQFQPNFCIIGEPSGWNGITLGYKGRLLIDYRLSQPMAHTAGPGKNAAEEGIAWINELDAYAQQFNTGKPRLFDQLLHSIRGIYTSSDGLANQIEIKLGLRLPPDFDRNSFEKWLGQIAGKAAIKTYAYEPAFHTKRANPLANQFNQAIRAAGGQPAYKLKTGTSDMNIVAPTWGCPIIAYGPGDSTLDHTPDEHIVIEEYLQAIDILQAVLTNLG